MGEEGGVFRCQFGSGTQSSERLELALVGGFLRGFDGLLSSENVLRRLVEEVAGSTRHVAGGGPLFGGVNRVRWLGLQSWDFAICRLAAVQNVAASPEA